MSSNILTETLGEVRLGPRLCSFNSPVLVSAVGLAALVGVADIRLSFLPLSFLFGWTQIGGLCGSAHVRTMRFLRHSGRHLWLKACLAYTLAGLVSSSVVGVLVSLVGVVGNWGPTSPIALPLVSGIALVLAVRELGWLRFRVPEWRCQTVKVWADTFGFVIAASMWGFHIGLGLLTVITYGGFWVLVALSVVSASPAFGMAIMAVYWCGRCFGLWMTPYVSTDSLDFTPGEYRSLSRLNVVGLLVAALMLGYLSATGLERFLL